MRDAWEQARLAPAAVPSVSRVALISLHTCPLDQPGTGDSGGLNVYVREVSRRLADLGLAVDIFTRSSGQRQTISEPYAGVRVIHLEAGPEHPIPKDQLHEHLCEFLYALLRFEAAEAARLGMDRSYDIVHGHYWMSGWVGRLAAERWEVPFVQSFHTLGRVKNLRLADGEPPEPAFRIAAEERIVATADCVLAPTAIEAGELVHMYGADAARVRVVAPGVDTALFQPGSEDARAAAKASLGLTGKQVLLFVGRLQPLKAPDIAVRALAALIRAEPTLDPLLVIVGGPSGNLGLSPDGLRALATELGVGDRIVVHGPVPHPTLVAYYRAADAVLVPSRSESFGLVAVEAAACGTPVVAADVGGLRTVVRDGITGVLVAGSDGTAFARALVPILTDPQLAASMRQAAARHARRFDWRRAAAALLEVYEEQVTGHELAAAASGAGPETAS